MSDQNILTDEDRKAIEKITIEEITALKSEIEEKSTIGEFKEVMRKFRDKHDLNDKQVLYINRNY